MLDAIEQAWSDYIKDYYDLSSAFGADKKDITVEYLDESHRKLIFVWVSGVDEFAWSTYDLDRHEWYGELTKDYDYEEFVDRLSDFIDEYVASHN